MIQKYSQFDDPGASSPDYQAEVLSFREWAPSAFFPSVVSVTVRSGQTRGAVKTICRFHKVEINIPIAPSTFQYTIPSGMKVMDDVKGISYVMGDHGLPKAEPISAPLIPLDMTTVYVGGDVPPAKRGLITVIATIALSVTLLVIIMLVVMRRIRQRLARAKR